jgi:uncharacterized protein (TIGR03435 family)
MRRRRYWVCKPAGSILSIERLLRIAFVLLLVVIAASLRGLSSKVEQEPATPASTEPLIVDVHPSPYRATIYYRTNIGDQRFDMRDATLLNMIELAYKREDAAIIGGQTWIDFYRFDVVAKMDSLKAQSPTPNLANSPTPPPNPYDQIRPFLQRVLAERFHLTYHTEDRPLPGFVMTVAKDGPKLTEAKDATNPPNCRGEPDKVVPGQVIITCTSQTIAQFLGSFGGAFSHPVIDKTGLTKTYDFTFKRLYANLRTQDEYIHLYTEAFSKQLGLQVVSASVSQPAIVVDKVDHAPTPNAPDIAKLIPAVPDLEFEVASIRPAAESDPSGQIRPSGSQITFTSFSMQDLITRAWQLPTGAWIKDVGSLSRNRFNILVKLPPGVDGRSIFQNQDLLDSMLQKLLIDRFGLKYHWGEQTGDSYVLLAGTPKMKKADPNSRSYCKFGPADGEKDVRGGADPSYDHQFHCQNVTMAQFADLVEPMAGSEVKDHVPDKTGLAGAYDFSLYYTSGRKLRTDTAAAAEAAKQAGNTSTTAPAMGMTVEDAFRKQLGLRLEKQPLTTPALIVDHVEANPTEN